jgi:hypothetical protein
MNIEIAQTAYQGRGTRPRRISRNDGGRQRPKTPPAHHLRPAMTELYWISLMMLNIGRYRATTAAPTHPPMTAIRIGSISEVRESTAASTS